MSRTPTDRSGSGMPRLRGLSFALGALALFAALAFFSTSFGAGRASADSGQNPWPCIAHPEWCFPGHNPPGGGGGDPFPHDPISTANGFGAGFSTLCALCSGDANLFVSATDGGHSLGLGVGLATLCLVCHGEGNAVAIGSDQGNAFAFGLGAAVLCAPAPPTAVQQPSRAVTCHR